MHCLSMKNNPPSVAYGDNNRILNTLKKRGMAIYMVLAGFLWLNGNAQI